MIVALNEMASQQVTHIEDIIKKCNMLLDYAPTYPDATIRYHARDMCLYIESDAAYLVQARARS